MRTVFFHSFLHHGILTLECRQQSSRTMRTLMRAVIATILHGHVFTLWNFRLYAKSRRSVEKSTLPSMMKVNSVSAVRNNTPRNFILGPNVKLQSLENYVSNLMVAVLKNLVVILKINLFWRPFHYSEFKTFSSIISAQARQ